MRGMTRGLILAQEGVSDSHLEYAYHRLREDAVLVDVASPEGGEIRGDREHRWETIPVGELPAVGTYDLVIIADGDDPERLARDDATYRWLSEYLETGGIVCAIAGGVKLLAAIDAIEGRLVTGPPEIRAELEAAVPTDEAVTVDGPIVTVRDTDALPFGIAATLGNVAIPQDQAAEASERPHWTVSDPTGQ